MPQGYIITRNYLDGPSRERGRYLVREVGTPPEQAIRTNQVRASGVSFERTGAEGPFAFEAGFGCGVVAVAQDATYKALGTAKSKPIPEGFSQLVLNWNRFVTTDTAQPVEKVTQLNLEPNGCIYAQIAPTAV